MNVLQENENAEAVLEIVRREQPDLLVLCEVNDRWMNDLAELDDRFSFAKKHPAAEPKQDAPELDAGDKADADQAVEAAK
jgi:hypothetical protein